MERGALGVPDSVIEENRYNFPDNLKEQKYRTMWYWIKSKGYRKCNSFFFIVSLWRHI